jgi:hypothetical protein
MGKNKKGRGSSHRSGDKQKREPSPPSEDFGDFEYSKEEFSSESKGSPIYSSPPVSSDDSDDSQGIATEVWTYIQSVERYGLEGSEESEVSSDKENSYDLSEDGGDDSDDEGDGGGGGDDNDDDDGKGDEGDGGKGDGGNGGKGDDNGKGSGGSSKASGKAPLA